VHEKFVCILLFPPKLCPENRITLEKLVLLQKAAVVVGIRSTKINTELRTFYNDDDTYIFCPFFKSISQVTELQKLWKQHLTLYIIVPWFFQKNETKRSVGAVLLYVIATTDKKPITKNRYKAICLVSVYQQSSASCRSVVFRKVPPHFYREEE